MDAIRIDYAGMNASVIVAWLLIATAAGLIARTPRGRVATAAGWRHLGLTPPPAALGAIGGAGQVGSGGSSDVTLFDIDTSD